MKKLIIPILFLMMACSKDDFCECIYYEMFDESADCRFYNKWDDVRIDSTKKEELMMADFNKYRCE